MSTPLERLLPRLANVRKKRDGQFEADCPVRAHRTAKLAIKEGDDGRILLHCFGGDSVEEITAAVGLEIGDLYPERIHHPDYQNPAYRKEQAAEWQARDVLRYLGFELMVINVTAHALLRGDKLERRDLIRMAKAIGHVEEAISLCGIKGARHV